MGSVLSMASSSSSTVPSSEQTSHFSCQTESEMESAKANHYSELKYSTRNSELSAESNFEYFAHLKNHPQLGRFFMDSERLELGKKIGEGAQADIYEARYRGNGPYDLVVKVMHGSAPLKAIRAQWPIGMLSARSKYKHLFDLPLITILGGTVLCDERLRGRFAFVMYRRWGDLRLLIDRRMEQERSTAGPFAIDEAIHLMLRIAEDMDVLHDKYDIIHHDLKASNVLVWGEFAEDMSFVAPPNRVAKIESVVADFECCVGVVGTGIWRAPEILEQLKDRVPRSELLFTRAADVYSYGMTCFEIVTGCLPSDRLEGGDTISQILEGQRPEIPHDLPVPEFVRDIIVACWHSDQKKRPTFTAICEALKEKRGLNAPTVVIDNISQTGASIVKVEKWNNSRALTLLEVMQKLMDMNLSILKAYVLSSTTMQCFEVVDREGRKLEGEESIPNISKALSLRGLDETIWSIRDNVETFVEGNPPTLQIYVIEVVAEWSAGLVTNLSRLFVATNFQVHLAGCWIREGRLECMMFVEGARMGTFLWELRHDMDYFQVSFGRLKIFVDKVGVEEFSKKNIHMNSLKFIDFTLPYRPSSIHLHLSKESREGFCSVEVCPRLDILGKQKFPFHVPLQLANMGYKIVGASIKRHRDLYESPRCRTNKICDIDVGTLGEDDREKIIGIQDLAIYRECSTDNHYLFVSGPREELGYDLMKSLDKIGFSVIGGHVYREFDTGLSSPCEILQFFVSKK